MTDMGIISIHYLFLGYVGGLLWQLASLSNLFMGDAYYEFCVTDSKENKLTMLNTDLLSEILNTRTQTEGVQVESEWI